MSIGHPSAESGDLYYECTECGYESPATVGIGLCPVCGDDLREKSAFA